MKKEIFWILAILVVFMGFFVFGASDKEYFAINLDKCKKVGGKCKNNDTCCTGKCAFWNKCVS
jgi:hypothetical protein